MRKWYHESSTLRGLMAPSELSRYQAIYISELPLARTRISRLQHFWRCPQFLKASSINGSLPWLNLNPSLGWNQFSKSSKLRELGKAVFLAFEQFSKAFCLCQIELFGQSRFLDDLTNTTIAICWNLGSCRGWSHRGGCGSCALVCTSSGALPPSFFIEQLSYSTLPFIHHHQPHCLRPQPPSQLSALVLRLLSSLPTWSSLRPNKAHPLQVL